VWIPSGGAGHFAEAEPLVCVGGVDPEGLVGVVPNRPRARFFGRGQTLTGNVLPIGWVEGCVVPAAPVAAEHLCARQTEGRNRQSQRAGQQRAVGEKFVEVGGCWVMVGSSKENRELRTGVGEHGKAGAVG